MSKEVSEIHLRQIQIWNQEWSELPSEMQTVPGHNSHISSQGVQKFAEYVIENNHLENLSNKLIDLGCGVGRNIPYLSRLFDVVGVDYSTQGLIKAKTDLDSIGSDFSLVNADLTQNWPFKSESFDFAIDSLTSASIFSPESRSLYFSELHRCLKVGGLILMRAVSSDDATEKELMISNPGPEPNSTLWPGSNKFQKNYSELEIKTLFKDFDILVMEKEIKDSVKKLGRIVNATNWWVVAQKKI